MFPPLAKTIYILFQSYTSFVLAGGFSCYNVVMEEKIAKIKEWLGTGSINVFGLPMSGKDTQGIRLAETLNAKFLSSGMIIRAMEQETRQNFTGTGQLLPTDLFYEWVLPYLERKDLFEFPLVLSSIGRWYGEERQVLSVAAGAGHPIKAVVLLNVSESDVIQRFEAAKLLNDRGERNDDRDEQIFDVRLKEFRDKTMPVLNYYNEQGLLINVNGDQSRDAVFAEMIEKLYEKASSDAA